MKHWITNLCESLNQSTESLIIYIHYIIDALNQQFLITRMTYFQIRTHVDPQTGCTIAYTPHGRFLHIPPPCPSSDWANDFGRAWWRDDCYCIGTLSSKTRFIRVINTLTSQEQVIEVGMVGFKPQDGWRFMQTHNDVTFACVICASCVGSVPVGSWGGKMMGLCTHASCVCI